MERPAPNAYLERADCAWSADSVRLVGTPSEAARSSYLYMQEAGHFKTRPRQSELLFGHPHPVGRRRAVPERPKFSPDAGKLHAH